jgi:hypothetical protein
VGDGARSGSALLQWSIAAISARRHGRPVEMKEMVGGR